MGGGDHLVKGLEVSNWRRAVEVVRKLVLEVCYEHAKLGAPISDVVQPV